MAILKTPDMSDHPKTFVLFHEKVTDVSENIHTTYHNEVTSLFRLVNLTVTL